jgi:hypothetical protein
LEADLLVISGDRERPYGALIEAQASDVQLVLIGGQPVLGTPDLMRLYWNDPELVEVSVASVVSMESTPKAIKLPNSASNASNLLSRLRSALVAQGTELAPLAESR